MPRIFNALLYLATAALLAACVAYPYVDPYASMPAPTSSFDRSWDAAQAAAAEVGVQVSSADRGQGRILGSKAGAAVAIQLRTLADGRLEVSFNAPDAKESKPTLQERWLAAYQRRMGR